MKTGFEGASAYIKGHALYIKIFLAYLAVALVMFWPITLGMFSSVVNGHGDVYQTLFNLWWVPHALFGLQQSPYFTMLLHYPLGSDLVTQTLSPLAGILVSPIYWLSPAFAYNLLYFLGFALSGLFMYMLAEYLIKNRHAAVLAGLIFAFSPAHVAQSVGGHLDWTMVEWMPLFVLFFIRALKERKLAYSAGAALSFMLLTFMGDIEQGIMMFFLAIVLTALMIITDRKEMLRKDTAVSLGAMIAIGLVLCSPFLLLMSGYLNSSALAVAQQNSAVAGNMQWSDNLLSFFLPSYYNGLFNGIASGYSSIYALTYQGVQYTINVAERVSYIGYSVMLLALIGIYADYKASRLKHSLIWIVVFVLFAWLALGPYLQVGTCPANSATCGSSTQIPGLYLLYKQLPIFNIIREPGRMDFVATIALAILAALGFEHLVKGKHRKDALTYLAVASIIILIEYNGMPLTPSYISGYTVPTAIPLAYSQIGKVQGNYSVLILPALANVSADPSTYIGMGTYFTTATGHPLVGGYTSRTNYSQTLSVENIPLATASSYLEYGFGLSYPYPINENYSNLTMLWLDTYNTQFVSVIRQAYNLSSQEKLYGYLGTLFGNPVYEDNTTFVFSTAAAVSASAGKSIVSYTVGNWTSGYSLCGSGNCNVTLESMWWGDNPRGMVVFSPSDQNVRLSFAAIGSVNGTRLGIYLNGDSSPVAQIPLSSIPYYYSVNFTAPKGFSELAFYSPPNPGFPAPYLAYGMDNITVRAR